MTRTRETFFECSFSSGDAFRTAHVRAWNAAEAEKVFRQVLADEGVEESGTIVVAARDERRASRFDAGPARARRSLAH